MQRNVPSIKNKKVKTNRQALDIPNSDNNPRGPVAKSNSKATPAGGVIVKGKSKSRTNQGGSMRRLAAGAGEGVPDAEGDTESRGDDTLNLETIKALGGEAVGLRNLRLCLAWLFWKQHLLCVPFVCLKG